jgi:hypothetical protein
MLYSITDKVEGRLDPDFHRDRTKPKDRFNTKPKVTQKAISFQQSAVSYHLQTSGMFPAARENALFHHRQKLRADWIPISIGIEQNPRIDSIQSQSRLLN